MDEYRLWPVAALVLLWVVSVFAPGYLVVRRLGWGPVERVCAAVGVSLFMIYLVATGIYLCGGGAWAHRVMAAGCVAAGLWCWRDWARLWRVGSVRRTVGVLAVVLVWGTACLAVVRHYSGGAWSYDWGLHYLKVQLFANLRVAPTARDVREMVIDRPSMMNLVGSYFIGVLGDRFVVYQVVFTWLNLLAVLPCCLLFGRFGGRRRVGVLLAVMVCLPVLWVSGTYTWTKLLAAYYVILGVALYLRAVEKGGRVRMVGAFVALAMGVLVHYAAVPYGVVTFGHYVVLKLRGAGRRGAGKRDMGELAWVVGCGVLVLATWFGWTTVRYGAAEMREANNTLRHAGAETWGEWGKKVGMNYVWNLVPHPLRPGDVTAYEQPSRLGYVRDYCFLYYQTNAILICGSVTAVVAAVMAWRGVGRLWRTAGRVWEGWFWVGLIVGLPVLGAVAVDVPSPDGVGHLFFGAWALMAGTLVAARVGAMPGWARWVLAAGMVVDFGLGVWLQFYLEHRVFAVTAAGFVDPGGMAVFGPMNYTWQRRMGLVFLGDVCAPAGGALLAVMVAGAIVAAGVVGSGARRARREVGRLSVGVES